MFGNKKSSSNFNSDLKQNQGMGFGANSELNQGYGLGSEISSLMKCNKFRSSSSLDSTTTLNFSTSSLDSAGYGGTVDYSGSDSAGYGGTTDPVFPPPDTTFKVHYNQGIGNGAEGGDPGKSRPHGSSNDETGRTPGDKLNLFY